MFGEAIVFGGLRGWRIELKAQVGENGAKPECISLKLLKSAETTEVSDCIIL